MPFSSISHRQIFQQQHSTSLTNIRWPLTSLFKSSIDPNSLHSSDEFHVAGSGIVFCLELELNDFGQHPYIQSFLHLSVREFGDEEELSVCYRVWMETEEGKKLTSGDELQEQISLANGTDRLSYEFRNEKLTNLLQQFHSKGIELFACCELRRIRPIERKTPRLEFREALWKAYKDGICGYCTLVSSDGDEFELPKQLLTSQSDVFKRMFLGNSIEALSERVVFEDVSSRVLKSLIAFLYLGKLEDFDAVDELFVFADKYNLEKLRLKCLHHLNRTISTTTFIQRSSLACFYDCPILIMHLNQHCQCYKQRMQKAQLMETEEWQSLCEKNWKLADKIKGMFFD